MSEPSARRLFIIVLPWHLAQYALHGRVFLEAYIGHEILERVQQP
jgi:hypothetical protein